MGAFIGGVGRSCVVDTTQARYCAWEAGQARYCADTVVTSAKPPNVCYGSKAEMVSRTRHVRSSPQSRHSSARVARPLCAKNRHGVHGFTSPLLDLAVP
jgi:hypothetical protein